MTVKIKQTIHRNTWLPWQRPLSRAEVQGRVLYDLYKRTVLLADNGQVQQSQFIMLELQSFYRGHKVRTGVLYLYYENQFHLLIDEYYFEYLFVALYCVCIVWLSIIDDCTFIASDK